MEKEKTFFDRTINIREALLLLMTKARTEKELKLLMDATNELENLCSKPHIN